MRSLLLKEYINALPEDHEEDLEGLSLYYSKLKKKLIRNQDIIICVQGDEPMMRPEMIKNVIKPFFKKSVGC